MRETHLLEILGAFQNSKVKVGETARAIKSSKFNGAKVFLEGVVCQVPKKPVSMFRYNENKGIFEMKNAPLDDYGQDREQEWCEEFFKLGLVLHFTFYNQYHTVDQLNYSRFKKHPFVHNDCGVDYSMKNRLDSVRPFYDSWTVEHGQVKFHWLEWTKINESKLQWNFFAANPFGEALMKAADRQVEIMCKALKDFGTQGAGIIWNVGNECMAEINPVTGRTVQLKSYGDTSEVHAYYDGLFKKYAEDLIDKKIKSDRNIHVVDGSETQKDRVRSELYKSITKPFGKSGGLGALYEIHNHKVEDFKSKVEAIASLTKKTVQRVLRKMIGSNDGSEFKNDLGKFSEDSKNFFNYCYHSGHLFEEGLLPNNPPKHPSKYQENLDKYLDLHLRMVE